MAKHKGTEFNNVNETWQQNERNKGTGDTAPANNNLDRIVKEEAAEYDNANKSERLLDGDRASVKDDEANGARPGSS